MTDHNPTYTDSKGRTPAERVAAIQRHGDPITQEQREEATALLIALLDAAGQRGVSIDDFDWTVDLPGGCLDVILAKTRRA
ncbi:hypothetical protein ACH4VM_39225 [Streptomyces sp. NPDC020792]|uniref:hypothetical protein n=1 Tax=Streptomyces sp. NPDC020792 TaxID=3365089 RepID=UPI0037AC17A0